MMGAKARLKDLAGPKGLVGGPFGSSLVGADYLAEGIPVIRGANLGSRELSGGYVFISEAKFRRDLTRNSAVPGDLVFTQRGTLGQVSIVPDGDYGTYVVSQSQMRLRVAPTVADPDFVYYACSTEQFRKQIHDNAIATGVPHINLGILGRLLIPLPSLPEQRAIAVVLGALDQKIAANAVLSAVARGLAVAVLAETADGYVSLSGVVTHHKKAVAPVMMGKANVWLYSLPAFDEGMAPVLESPSSIKSGKFNVAQQSVLVSKLNPRFPRIWDVPSLRPEPMFASTEFVVLESRFSSSTVLWAALSQAAFSQRLEGKVSGTSGSHQRVRPDDLLATDVADVRRLSAGTRSRIDGLGRRALVADAESRVLAELRDVLLPQLMSGAIRVKDAEEMVGDVV
jgi:type I restriction enzyme S subunit